MELQMALRMVVLLAGELAAGLVELWVALMEK
jgi:hypothetical protein